MFDDLREVCSVLNTINLSVFFQMNVTCCKWTQDEWLHIWSLGMVTDGTFAHSDAMILSESLKRPSRYARVNTAKLVFAFEV